MRVIMRVFFCNYFLMNGIYSTDKTFEFDKLILAKPYQIPGGSFFIRFAIDNKPLYIQPPTCISKQGIAKAGKKYYVDLMFTNEHSEFIEWMECLETYCHEKLYEHKNEWFESGMEMHDIENYFTSPLKIFKSGKFYIARVNIATHLGKPSLKIYNDDEKIINIEDVKENTNVMTILEIKGIKCSSTSFQIDVELKQMMTLKKDNLFDNCIFKSNHSSNPPMDNSSKSLVVETKQPDIHINNDNTNTSSHQRIEEEKNDIEEEKNDTEEEKNDTEEEKNDTEEEKNDTEEETRKLFIDTTNDLEQTSGGIDTDEMKIDGENGEGLQEIDLTLDKIPESQSFSIKDKNNVYYEMYKEAKRKAKVAKNLAISSLLEAKRIKNVYMIEDSSDTDDSIHSDYENLDEDIGNE